MKPPLTWEFDGEKHIAKYRTQTRFTRGFRDEYFGAVKRNGFSWFSTGREFTMFREFHSLAEAKLFIEAVYAID